MPLIIEIAANKGKYVVCHADYPGNHYQRDKPVDEESVVWSRERITSSQRGQIQAIEGADGFIFGHTPLPAPHQYANQFYIDTGAVFSGNLTLIPLQGGEMGMELANGSVKKTTFWQRLFG